MRARDLLGARLVDHVVVAGAQHTVEQEADLVLAEVALPLGRLHVHAGRVHLVADLAQHRLDLAAAEDGVVDVVEVGGREVAVAGEPGLLVRVLEDDELELGADEGSVARVAQPVELLASLDDRPASAEMMLR